MDIFSAGMWAVGRTGSGAFCAIGLMAQPAPPRIVQESPPRYDEGAEVGQHEDISVSTAFHFKVEGGRLSALEDGMSKEDYLNSVLSWSSLGFVGRQRMDRIQPSVPYDCPAALKFVCIGSFTVSDVTEMLQNAADFAGFSIYAHRSSKVVDNRCSISFGCDHGRKRYGDDAEHQVTVFEKELDSIVKDSCRKRRSSRKNHGHDTAVTARRRLKNDCCGFHFTIISYQTSTKFEKDVPSNWYLSSHKKAIHCFDHTGHTFRGTRIRLTSDAKRDVFTNCEAMTVSDLVSFISCNHKIDVTASQVNWLLRSKKLRALQFSSAASARSGWVTESVQYLLKTKNSDVILLIVGSDGQWKTAIPRLSGSDVVYEVREYVDREKKSNKLKFIGMAALTWIASFLLQINGTLSIAWSGTTKIR